MTTNPIEPTVRKIAKRDKSVTLSDSVEVWKYFAFPSSWVNVDLVAGCKRYVKLHKINENAKRAGFQFAD